MKVRAKYNVTYNGEWVRGGTEFEIATTEDYMLPHVDVIETPVHEDDAKKRGRPKRPEQQE